MLNFHVKFVSTDSAIHLGEREGQNRSESVRKTGPAKFRSRDKHAYNINPIVLLRKISGTAILSALCRKLLFYLFSRDEIRVS